MNGFGNLGAADHAYLDGADRHVFQNSPCLFDQQVGRHGCKRHHVLGVLHGRSCNDWRAQCALAADGFNIRKNTCAARGIKAGKAEYNRCFGFSHELQFIPENRDGKRILIASTRAPF